MHRKNHILTILALACLFQGCALGQKDNRILLNALDKGVADTPISRSAWSRTAAAPLAIPVGVAAGLVDLVLITPARTLTPAWQDTSAFLWENPSGLGFPADGAASLQNRDNAGSLWFRLGRSVALRVHRKKGWG